MCVLDVLAALVPIGGSLYAGVSFLGEQSRLRWEHRTRAHIAKMVEARRPAAAKRAERVSQYTRVRITEIPEMSSYRKVLERAHGLPETDTSYRAVGIRMSLSGTAASPGEVRRQAVLLTTALAGVVLLALSGF